QPRSDATDVRDEVVSEILAEREQLVGCLDPRGRGDGAITLRGRGEVGRMDGRRVDRTLFEGSHGSMMASASVHGFERVRCTALGFRKWVRVLSRFRSSGRRLGSVHPPETNRK